MNSGSAEWYENNEEGLGAKACMRSQECTGWNHKSFIEEALSAESLLDIGCGRGNFLREAEINGYSVTGIDFDRTNISIAREAFGLQSVYAMTIEEFIVKYPQKKFDVITFFEVLEHVHDPKMFLENVRRLLIPSGYIALSVPNRKRLVNTIAYLDKPPYHLTRWSKTALTNFLCQGGFVPIHIRTSSVRSNDLADVVRFGIGRKLLHIGSNTNQQKFVHAARRLYKLKYLISKIFTSIAAAILRAARCQGNSIYCLARSNPDFPENKHGEQDKKE